MFHYAEVEDTFATVTLGVFYGQVVKKNDWLKIVESVASGITVTAVNCEAMLNIEKHWKRLKNIHCHSLSIQYK